MDFLVGDGLCEIPWSWCLPWSSAGSLPFHLEDECAAAGGGLCMSSDDCSVIAVQKDSGKYQAIVARMPAIVEVQTIADVASTDWSNNGHNNDMNGIAKNDTTSDPNDDEASPVRKNRPSPTDDKLRMGIRCQPFGQLVRQDDERVFRSRCGISQHATCTLENPAMRELSISSEMCGVTQSSPVSSCNNHLFSTPSSLLLNPSFLPPLSRLLHILL